MSEITHAHEILRCEVGSTAHGCSLPGTDDLDLMAIAVEHPGSLISLNRQFEHWQYRSAEERDGKGAPSQHGDIDLIIHSLIRFSRLAAKGNPSILMMLYAPVMSADHWGESLLASRHLFSSKEAGKRFLGYLIAQRQRLLGERGGLKVTRKELIEKHGYDTKYAYHALRLGYQGRVLMLTGEIPVPVNAVTRKYLLDVRAGEYSLQQVVSEIEKVESKLRGDIETSFLPDYADTDKINDLILSIYKSVWQQNKLI